MKQLHIIILSSSALPLARKIQGVTGGSVGGLSNRVTDADFHFDDVGEQLRACFAEGAGIIAIMASGAIIRLLAAHISDKNTEPPVLAVSPDGTSVIPLLGGHHGANELACNIASALGSRAAITTAGDVHFAIALDEPPAELVLANPQNSKPVMAELINGASVALTGKSDWLQSSNLPFDHDGDIKITVSNKACDVDAGGLVYHAKSLVLGVGCERGADGAELIELAEQTLREAGYAKQSIAAIASVDLKADEPAVHAVARHFGVEARFFTAEALEKETPRLAKPSKVVFAEVGCHGVSEGAALASVGADGHLVVEKQKSRRCTIAVAEAAKPFNGPLPGRSRGRLYVVGIGPGSKDWRSPEVSRMIASSDDLVGYSLYLDLVKPLITQQTRHDFPLGKEEDRVRHAMELAGQGRDVSLVCSGDAGIYAMATLVFELLADGGLSDNAQRIAIDVSPGISALQAAAARAGAPLGHDFCTISLSDLLTPWEAIQMRVKAAAEGDFVIAFYNPVSKRRRSQLAYARDVLLQNRPKDTPVILATNLGREGELVRTVALADLDIDEVDMLTVVIVGSSETQMVKSGDGRSWVYTPRGYAAKAGTGIVKSEEART